MSGKYINSKLIYQTMLMLSFGLLTTNSFSQVDDNKNEVTVVAAYEPTISDAFKINFSPNIKDSVFEQPKFSYGIQSTKIATSFQIEPIKPAVIVGDPIVKLYKNLIKAGFGTYVTPYFELFANSVRSKTYAIGLHAKHLSSSGSITDYSNSNFSNNEIEVYGRNYFKKATIDGELFFHRDAVHYYGYKPADFPLFNEDTYQRYTLVGFNTAYTSNYLDSNNINHQLSLGFYNLSDYYKSHENNIKLGINLDKSLQIFDFTDQQTIGIKTSLDYYNNGGDLLPSGNSMILDFKPFISTNFGEYMFSIGLDACIATTTGVASKLHIYPNIEASLSVIPKILKVYGGFTGGLNKNSFKSISDENPYIGTIAPLGFSNKKFEIYGGINTSLTKAIDFNASISNATTDNMPLFVNDTMNIAHNKFTVVYDNVNLLKISASLLFKYDEKMNITLQGNLYRYSTDQEAEAWHKPGFDASLTMRYNISNKIICRAEIYTFTKMYAKTYVNSIMKSETISGMFDVNFGLEYRYSKILSGFINLNNLAAMRYQNWYNYPNQRFSLMAGITYAF
ncbi:MAG: hypothetical protein ACOYO1_16710 [Bacteroidales bacterium]